MTGPRATAAAAGGSDPSQVREELRALAAQAQRRLGRPLRILHIGNIANNAYNNAKMMNEAGFDCDVLCAGYYHIMGTPEWEDADIEGDVVDHFNPDWTAVDLRGFVRPDWFAQGPLGLALDYLHARRTGRGAQAERLWRRLGYANRTREVPPRDMPALLAARALQVLQRWGLLLMTPERSIRRLRDLYLALMRSTAHDVPLRAMIEPHQNRLVAAATAVAASLVIGLLRAFAFIARQAYRVVARAVDFVRRVASGRPLSATAEAVELEALARRVIEQFGAAFPDSRDRLSRDDVIPYAVERRRWRRTLACYEVVQGYAIDPIYPMIAGRPYFAFEHGTLREIPFREDAMGRMTALAYHRAQHVFVTNSDCVDNARRLAGERVTAIPHPFDERRLQRVNGAEALRAALRQRLDADFLFFFPTRHDWVAGTGFADKANDRFLRVFARLRADGWRVGLVTCEWGKNVPESQRLLRELGCERHVEWRAPMCVVRYERMVSAVDVVVDQFLLGAFGGVTFRALAAGTPVCTYLREDEVAASFGASPPILNCRTEEDIDAVLRRALAEPRLLADIRRDSSAWVAAHHGGAGTVLAQVRHYCDAVATTAPA